MSDEHPFDAVLALCPSPDMDGLAKEMLIPTGFLVSLSDVQSIDQALAVYAAWAPGAIGADRCSIALVDDAISELKVQAINGAAGIPEGAAYAVDGSIMGAVFLAQRPAIMLDLAGIGSPGVARMHDLGYQCSGIAPLVAAGECFGVLNASFKTKRSAQDPAWAMLVLMARCLAMQIALLRQRDDLAQLALRDQLTGLSNRHHFVTLSGDAWATWAAGQQPYSLILIDIDRFKAINDAFGHSFGDHALRDVATRISRCAPAFELAARLGSEEFVILLPDHRLDAATDVAEQCRRLIESAPVHKGHSSIPVTCSFGVAEVMAADTGPEDTLSRADAALYEAKKAGRNRVVRAVGQPD